MNLFDSMRDSIESHRSRWLAGVASLLCVAALVSGIVWWSSRWKPPPSIFDTPVDDVMGYLALDDFSKLPLNERVRYLLDFANRFRGLSQSESAVLAGFLAGLSGPARETLRQNVRLLAKDIFADGARRYLALRDEDEKRRFLDDWLVEWAKTAEALIEPEAKPTTDEARLADIKRDGEREASQRPRRPVDMDGEDASRFLGFWQSEVEVSATPKEQGQIVRFITDLRDHVLR